MACYRRSVFFLSIAVSFPALFSIVIGLLGGGFSPFLFGTVILLVFWGIYFMVRRNGNYSAGFSFAILGVLWSILLIQEISRIVFIIENEGMDSQTEPGSPLAFLLGMVWELIFFVPLSVVLVCGLRLFYRRGRK